LEIVLLQNLAGDAHQWLAARHQLDYRPELVDDLAGLRSRIYTADALVVPPRLKINNQLLDFAPKLVAIARIHDGSDNLDFEACQRRGVRIIQASGATVRAHAEHLLLSLLTLFRHGAQPPGSDAAAAPLGREINDSVIGLLGLTPPAQLLATMLIALGARVVGYDPSLHRSAELWQRLGVQPMGLTEMLKTADAVSVQLAYASRYRKLISEHLLLSCKPGQLWSSTTNSLLFDLEALAAALRSGHLGGFVLDSDDEQLADPGNPLTGVDHLRITPRVAALTQESLLRGSWYLADRLHKALYMSHIGRLDELPQSQPMTLMK
jgi:phosphoglycerate dehydrogenase-like enzyme